MNSPILILANLLILMMVFLVVPVWIIVRLKQPPWTKLLLGFNYFALLIILFVQISAMGSLFHANQVAKKNCEALIRALRNEPGEKVAAVLEEYLAHDEGSYFLLAERFPEQEEPAISTIGRSKIGLPSSYTSQYHSLPLRGSMTCSLMNCHSANAASRYSE